MKLLTQNCMFYNLPLQENETINNLFKVFFTLNNGDEVACNFGIQFAFTLVWVDI
jgi:hypothetical protein